MRIPRPSFSVPLSGHRDHMPGATIPDRYGGETSDLSLYLPQKRKTMANVAVAEFKVVPLEGSAK
jgi:hypothetical protein